jgi:hypothetical protein
MKEYENTGSLGVPGRATARGLERLNFIPIVSLLAIFLAVTIAVLFITHHRPRTEQDHSNQYTVIERTLTQQYELVLGPLGVDIPPVPARDDWSLRSFGDIDRWESRLDLTLGERSVSGPITIEFNQKKSSLAPRIINWGYENLQARNR